MNTEEEVFLHSSFVHFCCKEYHILNTLIHKMTNTWRNIENGFFCLMYESYHLHLTYLIEDQQVRSSKHNRLTMVTFQHISITYFLFPAYL